MESHQQYRLAVKATVEFELREWLRTGERWRNRSQVVFMPMTNYKFEDDVILYDDANSIACQKIMLEDIRLLFQAYFDFVGELTNKKFIVRINEATIVVEKVYSQVIIRRKPSKTLQSRRRKLKQRKIFVIRAKNFKFTT